jgi:Na+/H+-dicarboxylate symporter
MFLVASKIVEMDDVETAIQQVGMYMATVVTGLVIHGFIILPLLYAIFVRKNPFPFIGGVLQALVTACATASRLVEEAFGLILDDRLGRSLSL